jgi:hypothetical protein
MFKLAVTRRATLFLLLSIARSSYSQSALDATGGCASHPHDAAAAAVLFREAYQLRQEGKDDAACKKFQESARLDAMAGTLFNLAECRANQGKTATAAGWYHKAAILAENQGDKDLLEKAKHHAQELDAELSYLTIRVEHPVPGIVIRRDDDIVGPAQFNDVLPLDPGEHTITAAAPGYQPLSLVVRIGEVADNKVINVPVLQLLPLSALPPRNPPSPTAPAARDAPRATNPWPWLLGGLGATATVVGAVSGVLALHDQSRVSDRCSHGGCTDAATFALQSQRDTEWNVARIAFPLGVLALGTAVTWSLADRQSSTTPVHASSTSSLTAALDPQGRHIWLMGRF